MHSANNNILCVFPQARERRPTFQSDARPEGPILPVVGEVHLLKQTGRVLQSHHHLQNQGDRST